MSIWQIGMRRKRKDASNVRYAVPRVMVPRSVLEIKAFIFRDSAFKQRQNSFGEVVFSFDAFRVSVLWSVTYKCSLALLYTSIV
jgi:hypothetical protein